MTPPSKTQGLQVPLKCECGKVQGNATYQSLPAMRIVCMCKDCQAFCHFLKNEKYLDDNGGSETVATYPSRLHITQGFDLLRCVRLSSEGGPLRWYSECCKMPLMNSMTAKAPFVGMYLNFIDLSQLGTPDKVLGPVFERVNGESGYGTLPRGTRTTISFPLIFAASRFLFRGWIKGLAKPCELYNPETGRPTYKPLKLSREQYGSLLKSLGPKGTSLSELSRSI